MLHRNRKKEYTHIINQKEDTDLGQFLNSREPYDKYKTVMNGTYFVDKSEILEELIPALQQEQRFFCITRPRRFGKTIMANMIAALSEAFTERTELCGTGIYDRSSSDCEIFRWF